MTWLPLDLTSLCVAVLIVTLCSLWAYVAVVRKSTKLPDFTLLHEVSQKSINSQSGNKKSPKSKGRRKRVDGSPKPSQLVNNGAIDEKKTPQATNEIKSQQQLGVQPVASRENVKKGSNRNITKGKHLNKPDSSAEMPAETKQGLKSKLKSSVNPVHVSDGNTEGEWQTQLSRPQLRALKQRQRCTKEPSTSDQVGISTSSSERHLVVVTEKSGEKAITSPTSTSSSSDSREKSQSSDTNCSADQDLKRHSNSSPESSLPASDVEIALREAACGNIEEKQEKTPLFSDITSTRKTQKRKKPRRKNKQVASGTETGSTTEKSTDVAPAVNTSQQSKVTTESDTGTKATGSQDIKATADTGSQDIKATAATGTQDTKAIAATGTQDTKAIADTGSQDIKATADTGSQDTNAIPDTGTQDTKSTADTGSQDTGHQDTEFEEDEWVVIDN